VLCKKTKVGVFSEQSVYKNRQRQTSVYKTLVKVPLQQWNSPLKMN